MREDTLSVNSFHTSGSSPTAPCRIGLLGCGTVGSAVVRRLAAESAPGSLALTHVFDRRAAAKHDTFTPSASLPPVVWTSRVDDLLTSDADIIVEAIGGVDDAVRWMEAALLAGKSVVTANKQAIAHHGAALQRLAARQGRQIRFEGAVGGAMPIVRTHRRRAGRRSRHAHRRDPERHHERRAVAHGGAALSDRAGAGRRAMRAATPRRIPPRISTAPMPAPSSRFSVRWRLDFASSRRRSTRARRRRPRPPISTRRAAPARRSVSSRMRRTTAARSTLTAWVAPAAVARGSFFARTTGPQNAAVISGAFAGDIRLSGAGAGGDATAVAVIGDLLAIARDKAAIVPAPALSRPHRILGYTTSTTQKPQSAPKSACSAVSASIVANERRLCERISRTAMSSLQDPVSRRSPLRLRSLPRPARAGVRLHGRRTSRATEIEARPKNLWRYRELLPITGEPRTGFNSGFTPLVRCRSAGRAPRRRASCTSKTTR